MAAFTYTNLTPTGTIADATVSRGIDVSGLTYGQLITGVSMTMIGLQHTWLLDFDIMLMAPGGQNLMVMSDVMGSLNSAYSDVTFSDAGLDILPSNSGFGLDLESGTYRPFAPNTTETLATFGLPDGPVSHATGDGVVSFATAFNGTNPNGQWTLYLEDNFFSDSGSMAAWSLTIQTNGNFASLTGTAGDDTITVTSTSATDGSYLISGSTPVGYTGVSGFDMIGLAGNDVLRGGDGNENIFGGAGRDMMYGGGADDWFYIEDGALVAGEVYDGGTGIDWLVFDLVIAAPQTLDLRPVSLRSIEQVDWAGSTGSGQLTLQMLASQIGNGNIANNATFTGRVGVADRLEFTMASSNTLDLSNLVLTGFGDANDRIVVTGDTSNETVTGTAFMDSIVGGGGNDILLGRGGDDILYGGAGNDVLLGGAGADILDGGSGTADRAQYTDATAGVRADLASWVTNTGFAQGDTYSSIEQLYGSFYGDTLVGDFFDNVIWGDAGNDQIFGGDGADVLLGGTGADAFDGGLGNDRVQYTDSATGIRVDLQVAATNTGIAAGDTFTSVEHLYGTYSSDTLLGDAVDNVLWGAGGNDMVFGRNGNDTLFAGAGNDTIYGNAGNDQLFGEAGQDVFVFDSGLGAGNVDTIMDYSVADDTIHLEDAIFTALAAGALSAGAFTIGAGATAAGHRIIYNSATGTLSYDADGNGAGAAVQFATLTAGLAMASTEFLVV